MEQTSLQPTGWVREEGRTGWEWSQQWRCPARMVMADLTLKLACLLPEEGEGQTVGTRNGDTASDLRQWIWSSDWGKDKFPWRQSGKWNLFIQTCTSHLSDSGEKHVLFITLYITPLSSSAEPIWPSTTNTTNFSSLKQISQRFSIVQTIAKLLCIWKIHGASGRQQYTQQVHIQHGQPNNFKHPRFHRQNAHRK